MKCWRCERKLNKGEGHILYLANGRPVPVCADDRQCYAKKIKRSDKNDCFNKKQTRRNNTM